MTSAARHHNCFYYFRGPGSKAGAVDKQLEDNCTKALINTLEHGGPALTRSFLATFAGQGGAGQSDYDYFLQGGPELPAPRRVLLGIAERDEIDPSSWDSDGGQPAGSRVDAAIHQAGELTVLIETKVVPALDGAQMKRHAERWGIPAPHVVAGEAPDALPGEWILTAWSEVHLWARTELEHGHDEPAALLLSQLAEFLGLAGLARSWRLFADHLEFFEQPATQRDPMVKTEIRNRLESLWAEVEEGIGTDAFQRSLGEVRVGSIPEWADHAFAQSNSEAGSGLPNLTIEIYADEVCVNVVGWFDAQRNALMSWLESERGDRFIRTHPAYELLAFVRHGTAGKGGKVMWKGANGEQVARFRFRDVACGDVITEVRALEGRLEPRTEKLSLHLRRSWDREQAVSSPDLAAELVPVIRELLPALGEIRHSKAGSSSSLAAPRPRNPIEDRILGCLLGGAVGDALGAPVEFLSFDEIRAAHGISGISGYSNGRGWITDDTQMTLFTAEGMIRAAIRGTLKGICHVPSVVGHAYLRWLHTQGERSRNPLFKPDAFDGWLINEEGLQVRRAPGATCLSALQASEFGSIEKPANDSKGCGGVMRAAPVGLSIANDPFDVGAEIAAVTHGHPSGYLSAGFLAHAVRLLAYEEVSLPRAVEAAREELLRREGNGECLRAIDAAVGAADRMPEEPTPAEVVDAVEGLGRGWVAEEALSIAVFCSLIAGGFEEGVLYAVNHGGDSDSTGAITGNLLGAALGSEAVPARWVESLELRSVIARLASDMAPWRYEGDAIEELSSRYPGW